MEKYLIDTNIIANYFAEMYSLEAMNFIGKVIDKTPNISVITQIEALSWVSSDKNKEQIIKEFINDSFIYGIDEKVVLTCIKLRRSQKIKTPDALIAATAKTNNLTLITNDNDFSKLPNLKIINPFSL